MWPFYSFRRCWEVISFAYWHLANLRSFICFLFLAGIWLIWCSWDGYCTCTVAAVTKQTEYLCTYHSALYKSFGDQQNSEPWLYSHLYPTVFRQSFQPVVLPIVSCSCYTHCSQHPLHFLSASHSIAIRLLAHWAAGWARAIMPLSKLSANLPAGLLTLMPWTI